MAYEFQVISLFPEMIQAAMAVGVFGQAQKNSLLQLSCIHPREFTSDVHKTVDDRPFGGGDGMIMMAEPLKQALTKARARQVSAKVVYLSPQGRLLTAAKAKQLAQEPGLILLCGRYGGIDQRLFPLIDEEISIGDYVLSGGEFAACVLMDAVSRFVPGVLGHQESADKDSFSDGLLEHPNFTRPRDWEGVGVPEILLSGNHEKIQAWKTAMSLLVTLAKRPELLPRQGSEPRWRQAHSLWQSLSADERKNLGLSALHDGDFDGRI